MSVPVALQNNNTAYGIIIFLESTPNITLATDRERLCYR